MTTWTNWAGNVVASPAAISAPASLDELRAAVATASAQSYPIRVAGSGHSFSPLCQTSGLLIDLSNLSGIASFDCETGHATIWAGTRIHALGEPLLQHGRALANQGDIDRQALAGAVATGTHGTGRRYGSFSNAVVAVELLSPEGDLTTIDSASPGPQLSAAALSLGLLGIITQITLATVPAYKLRERTQALDFDTCLATYPGIEAAHRNAEFWWIPPLDTCVLKTFSETTEEPFSQPETEHPPGTLERYLKPDKVDWSSRVYPSTRSQSFVECEYTLPLAAGPDAMRDVRTLIQRRYPDMRWGVEYRTMPGETHLLSPTSGQDSVTISVHQAAEKPWESFMRETEDICRDYGGRPHWGKLHWLTGDDVESLYPDLQSFGAIRAERDPHGRLLNDHLASLFG